MRWIWKHIATRRGFTLVEAVTVAALIAIIAGMGLSVVPVMRRASIQTRALSKMKLLASYQHDFRRLGDLSLNPEQSYGTYDDLVNAGYIARDIVPEDDASHAPFAFIPYYKVSIGLDIANMSLEPDGLNYAIVAEPIGAPRGMPILYMEEDGEVFTFNKDGTQRVLR